MIKIYGTGKDTIRIEGSTYKTDKIRCNGKDIRFRFEDGSVMRFTFPKDGLDGVWGVVNETTGTKSHIIQHYNPEAEINSDIYKINCEIKSHTPVKRK